MVNALTELYNSYWAQVTISVNFPPACEGAYRIARGNDLVSKTGVVQQFAATSKVRSVVVRVVLHTKVKHEYPGPFRVHTSI